MNLSAAALQRCCRSASAVALVQRNCRITQRCHIPNLKSLGHVVNVLECCRTAAGLLQKCCRAAADLLQIMKAHYLEMLHAKFEVSKSNSMVVRELKVTLQKLAPP